MACSYQSLSTDETDVVLTLKDEGRDYSELKTYALANEVIDLCRIAELPEMGAGGFGGDSSFNASDCFEVDHRYDETILQTLSERFDELGYRRVDDVSEETPDFIVLPAIVARNNWFVGWGWCDPYYYSGCWFPSYSYAYNLPTGTILVQAVDVSSSEEEGTHFVVRVPRVPAPGGRPRAATSGPMRVSA